MGSASEASGWRMWRIKARAALSTRISSATTVRNLNQYQNRKVQFAHYTIASWFDHPRDLLHLINVKRAEMPRPIVGIGHSMGGAHLSVPDSNATTVNEDPTNVTL